MEFDSAQALRRATGRAKSDVANKLVCMLLHEISRRACAAGGMSVSDPAYSDAVIAGFGHLCVYCGHALEHDRAAVEHLDGMNRFRIGLHVPGNVAMACRRCNGEKRRDDQLPALTLAPTGWQSFLSHDGRRCLPNCKTCAYWFCRWPEATLRHDQLAEVTTRIADFQKPYARFITWTEANRLAVQIRVEALYRSCQQSASAKMRATDEELKFAFHFQIPASLSGAARASLGVLRSSPKNPPAAACRSNAPLHEASRAESLAIRFDLYRNMLGSGRTSAGSGEGGVPSPSSCGA